MRTCATCRREEPDDSVLFCPRCGRPIGDEPVASAPALETASLPSPDSSAAESTTYPCGHAFTGDDHCTICGGTKSRSFALETPWGLVSVSEGGVFLGRDPAFSPHAAVLAAWDNVSGQHAVVRLTPDGVVVEDRYSTNGTFIDALKLGPGESRLAPPGSEIRLASDPPLRLLVVAA